MSKDVIIVGAGPSALTAAIYLSREDVDTTLYERGVVGGMAAITAATGGAIWFEN